MRIKITSGKEEKQSKRPVKKAEQCCSGAGSCAEKEEQIRKKAYELYEKRGCQPGCEWEDWFEAEKMCEVR